MWKNRSLRLWKKQLKNKKHFSTLFPRGSEIMSGLPRVPQAQLQIFLNYGMK
jgi:hypothetical protein